MSRRGKRADRTPAPRPVQQIELDEKPKKWQIVLFVVLLVIGLGGIGIGVWSSLDGTSDQPWDQIQPVGQFADSVADEMVFLYELGASGRAPDAESKELSALYTELCIEAYRIFDVWEGFDGVKNLHEVDAHPNEEVEVDETLYRALKAVDAAGARFLFAAPFYREYRNLFSDTDDATAIRYDPYKSEEIAAYFAALSVYTGDAEHIHLELSDGNKVKLVVSDAYLAFAEENDIEHFVEFYWARNAFAVDYIADSLIQKGYTYGSISSRDGFLRVLDERDTEYAYGLFGWYGTAFCPVGQLTYTGRRSMIFYRTYKMNEPDDTYYTYKSGERRHPYVDASDGLCKNALDELLAYSSDGGCADLLLATLPLFLTDESPDPSAWQDLKQDGIYAVYLLGTEVHHTESSARIGVYREEGLPPFSVVFDE